MGSVFLARDQLTGRLVALKVLLFPSDAPATRRFAREAKFLASLHHPGIVSYVAHGLAEEGQPFLAMEWLEGEDLAKRLRHKPLNVSESLQLLRRVAGALASAHSQGVIHRDLKPSNLFLRDGQPSDTVLLDFGLAYVHAASQSLTGSAMVLGTPGYMAPEQASSCRELSPAADIFSLGCVFYECLTGQPPFRAPHLAAVLAKILFSEPVPLSSLRPELPASLVKLLEGMLTKDPSRRPAHAGELLSALEALQENIDFPPPSRPTADTQALKQTSTALMHARSAQAEQHLVSVLLATPASSVTDTPTLSLEEGAQEHKNFQQVLQNLQAHTANAALLADGSLLAAFILERGTATDQASLAAHCALFVKESCPGSMVALTTGLSMRGLLLPVGDAVDRASELIHLQKAQPMARSFSILVDDTTVGLLSSRFVVDKPSATLFVLSGEHPSVDDSRPLLGRPTSCVGRDQELAVLEQAYTSCVEDSSARTVLVTAPAGVGKSRLRHELLRRLTRHSHPPLVLLGRGDPMGTSAAHGLLGQAVRRICEVMEGEPLEIRRDKLARRVSLYLPREQHSEVTEFVGELCAIPFPAENSPRLRAAREDPQLMNAQVTRALLTWLKAECAQRPVLLMLEDLHWSDGPSINLIEEVLHELTEQPLMVLALARPEVKGLFPGLWARYVQEVPLRGLSQKASTRLVREALGSQVPEDVVVRVVGQAAGNALFLEELIRGVAEGRGEETPGSVLAMLQSRLLRLEPKARSVVLAASIFGRAFWADGLSTLMSPDMSSEELAHWLQRLVDMEMVQPQPSSRFPGQTEYRFHHALLRDAAYDLVPDPLRATRHLLAGEWLESTGESEPLVLAEHYKLGGQKQKALFFFTRACRQNCERQRVDLQGAQRCLKAALDCEPSGEALTELQVLEADLAFWLENFERAVAVSQEVLPKLSEGSAPWSQIVGNLVMMNTLIGRPQESVRLGQRLLAIEPAPGALAAYSDAIAFLNAMYHWTGQRTETLNVIERLAQVAARGHERDSFARGRWCFCQGVFDYDFEARPWRARELAEEAIAAFGKAGAERNHLLSLTLLGQALSALGEVDEARNVMHAGLARAKYFDQAVAYLQLHMALILSGSLDPEHWEEARRLSLPAREAARANPRTLALATAALARVALAQGSPAEALALAREACELLGGLVTPQLVVRPCLSAALLAQGHLLSARAEAEQGVRMLEQIQGAGATAVGIYLALAEACLAQGDDGAAEGALRSAWQCLRLRAEDLPNAAARQRFLSQVPENTRLCHLVHQRWGESLNEGGGT